MDQHQRWKEMQELFFQENDTLRNRVAELEAQNANYQDVIEGLRQTIEEKDAKIKNLEETLSAKQPIKKAIQKQKKKGPK